MKKSILSSIVFSAIVGVLAVSAPAVAKTAKECQAEWRANKAANQAKGITEKVYVAQCKGGASAEKPKATPAAAAKKKNEKTSTKTAAPAAGKTKTVKECQAEWRANKIANQAKGITEKAYVTECRAGGNAAQSAPAPMPANSSKTKAKTTVAPASAPAAKSTAMPAAAPAAANGANQYATEAQAKARCGSGTVIWVNLNSKIYHFAGHKDFGNTKRGAYMCERDATSQGMRAAKNEKHP
jgi:hypothetical protein